MAEALPLRVCVFASASPETPKQYTTAASDLGKGLASRGLVCVNGGGSQGCMGALNMAMQHHGGHVRGVIHQKWMGEEAAVGLNELRVVGGPDLLLRKRGLFEDADCLVALPGGVGTIDELFDAIAGVHTRFSTLPICLVNVDGYYDHLLQQLQRTVDERLLRMPYSALLHCVRTAEEAVEWCSHQQPRERRRRGVWATALADPQYARGLIHGAVVATVLPYLIASTALLLGALRRRMP